MVARGLARFHPLVAVVLGWLLVAAPTPCLAQVTLVGLTPVGSAGEVQVQVQVAQPFDSFSLALTDGSTGTPVTILLANGGLAEQVNMSLMLGSGMVFGVQAEQPIEPVDGFPIQTLVLLTVSPVLEGQQLCLSDVLLNNNQEGEAIETSVFCNPLEDIQFPPPAPSEGESSLLLSPVDEDGQVQVFVNLEIAISSFQFDVTDTQGVPVVVSNVINAGLAAAASFQVIISGEATNTIVGFTVDDDSFVDAATGILLAFEVQESLIGTQLCTTGEIFNQFETGEPIVIATTCDDASEPPSSPNTLSLSAVSSDGVVDVTVSFDFTLTSYQFDVFLASNNQPVEITNTANLFEAGVNGFVALPNGNTVVAFSVITPPGSIAPLEGLLLQLETSSDLAGEVLCVANEQFLDEFFEPVAISLQPECSSTLQPPPQPADSAQIILTINPVSFRGWRRRWLSCVHICDIGGVVGFPVFRR